MCKLDTPLGLQGDYAKEYNKVTCAEESGTGKKNCMYDRGVVFFERNPKVLHEFQSSCMNIWSQVKEMEKNNYRDFCAKVK